MVVRRSGVCRAAIGPCDAPEMCDGSSDVCPTDKVKSSTTVCKAAGTSPSCDPADTCDGVRKLCPSKTAAPGTMCEGGKVCRLNGVCG